MTDKELRRLSRSQLLELMLAQSKRIDKLERELEKAQDELENRRIVAEEAGSIAEAALRLSGIFEAAQQAADMYLESVQQTARKTKQEKADFDFEDWKF